MLRACLGLAFAAWAILLIFGMMIVFCCKPDMLQSSHIFFTSLFEVAYIAAYPAVAVFAFALLLVRKSAS